MRAIEFHGGERVELVERPDPEPGPGELLIAPEAVGICGTDVEIYEGGMAYFREGGLAAYPVVPGHEWSGTVLDTGPGVAGFAPGDRVVGEVAIGCGRCVRCRAGRPHVCATRTETGIARRDGAMATRLAFPAAHAYRVDLPARAAALVEPASVALNAARRGEVAGRTVAVVGAGPIGLLVAQCARAESAGTVLVADTRPDRLALAAQLGFAPLPEDAGPDDVDVAILCAGGPAALAAALEIVRPGGVLVAVGLCGHPTIPFDFDRIVLHDLAVRGVLGSVGMWPDAIRLIAAGHVQAEPLVTGEFALDRVPDALAALTAPGSMKILVTP
jgi:2-desacetyl-2-hydroxyethyl bacteriochlorophyllide A dehydrogenase